MISFQYCKVMGPYNSGTSLMERYLSELFITSAPEKGHVFKHSVPPHFYSNQTAPGEDSILLNIDADIAQSVFICMVRLPYYWLLSTLHRPYWLQFETTENDFSQRLRSPVTFKGRVYQNPVQLWNHYYRQYAKHGLDNDLIIFIRLEDLALQPERTLTGLESRLERRPGTHLEKVISDISSKPSKKGNTFGRQWGEKYRLENVATQINAKDLAFINSQLEMDLLQKFDYPAVWIRPEIC